MSLATALVLVAVGALDATAPPSRDVALSPTSSAPTSPARVTLLWTALQLIPSPEIVIWQATARFGMRWQVTPLLYSFGANRRLSRWRSFAIEPIARYSGSIELYASPEILAGSFSDPGDRFLGRAGAHVYLPLVQRGEYVSISLGSSAFAADGKVGAAFDAGVHIVGGLLGARVSHSPTPGLRMTSITFEIRIL